MTTIDAFEAFLQAQDDPFIKLHNKARIRIACNPWHFADYPSEIAWVRYTKDGYEDLGNYMVEAPRGWKVPWPTSRNAQKFFGRRHAEMLKKVASPPEIVSRMNALFEGQLVVCAGSRSLVLFQKLLEASHVEPTFELVQGCGPNFSIPVRTDVGVINSSRAFWGYY